MSDVYWVWVINRVMIVIIMRWCAGDRSQEVRQRMGLTSWSGVTRITHQLLLLLRQLQTSKKDYFNKTTSKIITPVKRATWEDKSLNLIKICWWYAEPSLSSLSSGEGLLLPRLMCIPIIRVINIITIITDHSRVPIIRDNFHLTDTGSCVALHSPGGTGNVMTSELSDGNCDHWWGLWPGNVTLWHHHDGEGASSWQQSSPL